jgi:RNA polymerase sigma-70 factor (ECF subfamily)
MPTQDALAARFESDRPRLRGVAYRMLGSLAEAEDAVQEAWLRLARTDTSEVGNLSGWLTTVVARVCLDQLRARKARREEPTGVQLPQEQDIAATAWATAAAPGPEEEALTADSVGLALLVVLDTLAPAERLAFVLHDLFGVSFEEIAPIVDRSPAAARQLASRARRRVRGAAPVPDADLRAQWQVVDAFQAAARNGDFDALVAVLDPDVVLRSDGGSLTNLTQHIRGATAVAGQALFWQSLRDLILRRALINGVPGVVAIRDGKPFSVGAFTVRSGKIVEIDFLADPERVARLELNVLDD